jgi:hypothetical protein
MRKIYNGTFTIINNDTGDYRTFRIKTVKEGPLEGKRVVSLMVGSNNESDYRGFAFANDNNVIVWKRFRPDGPWQAYAKALMILMTWETIPESYQNYKVEESRACVKCNRKLTTPESIELGIGPVCAGS